MLHERGPGACRVRGSPHRCCGPLTRGPPSLQLGPMVEDMHPAGGVTLREGDSIKRSDLKTPKDRPSKAEFKRDMDAMGFNQQFQQAQEELKVPAVAPLARPRPEYCLTTQHLPVGGGGADTPPPSDPPPLSDWANFSPGLRPIKNILWRLWHKSVQVKKFLWRLRRL